ncbi:MAG: DUF3021 family protein [Oscillospiraceae bacterium]
MKLFKDIISYFTKITTGTLLICLVAIKLSGVDEWTTDILWHIPLLGLVTTIISVAALPDKDYTRREGIIRYSVHFVLLSAAVLIMGAAFGWYRPSLLNCAVMLLYVVAVYAFTYLTRYISSKRSADELNKALEQRKHGK